MLVIMVISNNVCFSLSTVTDDQNNQHNSSLLPSQLPTWIISNVGDFFT